MNCPHCDQQVDAPSASACPHCERALRPESEPYAQHLEVLNTAISRLIRGNVGMTVDRANGLFAHVAGAVQQMLDAARDDLDRNFQKLTAVDRDRDPEIGRLVDIFNEAQREINEALGDFGRLLVSAGDPTGIDRNRGAFEQVKTRVQAAVATLSVLAVESGDPLLAAPASEPLPPQVPVSLDAISEAMLALDRYITDRDPEGVEACLRFLEAARAPLTALLGDLRAAADVETDIEPDADGELEAKAEESGA